MIEPQEKLDDNRSKEIEPFRSSPTMLRKIERESDQTRKSLQFKLASIATALGVIPLLVIAMVAIASNWQVREQIAAAQLSWEVSKFEAALQQQWLTILLWSGIAVGVTGAIAVYLTNRAIRPLLSAAVISTRMVNRLRQEEMRVRDRVAGEDELKALQTNLQLLDKQLPELLWKQEADTEAAQLLLDISHRLREAHSEEDVLRTTVEQVRQSLRADRVTVFRFDNDWQGTFVEESVALGLPKTLWAQIDDSALQKEDLELYRLGRSRAINNVYQSELSDRYLGLLARFAVRATLAAPIFSKSELFGLLIAHQCSSPRDWQQVEIDLFSQIATQVGFALQQANLSEQLETKTEQVQTFIQLTRSIRKSFHQEDILRTTVEEIRKEIKVDRVIVYGTEPSEQPVVVESVASGFPKVTNLKSDPVFLAEGYFEQESSDRVQAIENLDSTNLPESCLVQLRQLGVKASLIVPIFREEELFGLLIAHQCNNPRRWQQSERDLLEQIATQVGFALEHAQLIEKVEAEKMQNETIVYISRRISESLTEEDILRKTVEEVRKEMRADRVVVYSFNSDRSGYIAAEAVLPGWQRAQEHKIEDACIPEHLRQAYINGRVVPTQNVLEAGFHPDHLQLMERLQIKSNLVAPILKDGQLFGLLIAHHCAKFHPWQKSEIDLMTQIATQVGFFFDRARLLAKVEAEREKTQLLRYITQSIRASLNEENVLKTTVSEVRKVMKTDRVIVYSFDRDWYGTVIAESVLPGYPKALWAKIHDPCFAESYVEQYRDGRVQATDNIYEADLTECHLRQLEPFAVKANLVAPILKNDQLFGLLIAHNCSEPHHWQPEEIDLFAQIALQVGFALDHARALSQLEQTYESNQAISGEQLQQLSQLVASSQTEVETLARRTCEQSTSVDLTRDRFCAITENTQMLENTSKQLQLQQHELGEIWQSSIEAIEQIVERAAAMHTTIAESSQKIEQLEQFSESLVAAIAPIANSIAQLKLQAMNALLEAARCGEVGQPFAAIAEQVRAISKQMEQDMTKLDPIVASVVSNAHSVAGAMSTETDSLELDPQIIEVTQQKLDYLNQISTQFNAALGTLLEAAKEQSQTTVTVDRSLLNAKELSQQTAAQSAKIVESWQKITTIVRELQKGEQ
jgi:GAF domain-containing protein